LDGSAITRHRCQFSYYCDGKDDVYPVDSTLAEVKAAAAAVDIAPKVMSRTIENKSRGATYYHATYVTPHWSTVYTKVAHVDTHVFYIHW
jgi:spore germination cell wall hydrolase CwlJ-like protein